MLLVLALAVFVVLVPALCAIAWVLWLRDLAERTGCSEWLSDTLTNPNGLLVCVAVSDVSLGTSLVTNDPFKAFVLAPLVCAFVVGVAWVFGWCSGDAILPVSLAGCAASFSDGDLQPAHTATLELPVYRLPFNAQDARPVMRLVVGNIERERPVERRHRQSEESDENGRRLLVLTPEQREAYKRYLADEHWYD